MIEIDYTQELTAILDALDISWMLADNGQSGSMWVSIDDEADARLERIVGNLSALRWQHIPGRIIQIQMELI